MPRKPNLNEDRVRRARMAAQLLHRPRRLKPAQMVRHLLGVQAQVLSAAGLALAARTEGLSAELVERARTQDRSIVLTWAMRGTLHLVAAEDHGWLQPLVIEPRIANSRRRLRELGMTGDQPDRAVRAVERMLQREGPLTRQEILQGLRRRGFRTADEAVAYHLVWLTASGSGVCYGPAKGRDRCFVLVRDWIGEPETRDRDSALAELAVRYLAGHGPATPSDLAFWSGLRLGDVKRAWRMVEDRLVEVEAASTTLWTLRSGRAEAPANIVRLLPNFDEYLLGWKDRGFVAAPAEWKRINRGGGWLHPVVLVDGRAAGTWRGERAPAAFRVQIGPFERLSPRIGRKVAADANHVAAFLGMRAEISTA
jgi:hypothetical protein